MQLKPPGGGGYGNPFKRDPQAVLNDVVFRYVSLEAAEKDYGVVIRYLGEPDRLVCPPEVYEIDWEQTEMLRGIN